MDITVPASNKPAVQDVLEEFSDDISIAAIEKDGEDYVQFQISADADEIDDITDEVRHIKDVDTGTLTVEILDQRARIEKGKQMASNTSDRSIQEMYAKALEYATFDRNSWILIALSVGIAEFGVMMDNPMVVIGAMVIAPLLGPFISSSFGLVIGDKRLIWDSGINAFLGLILALTVSFLLPVPSSTRVTEIMSLVSTPAFITIPLSLFVGSASALTFVSGHNEQLAGVAVAIALVPPAAVAGLSLKLGEIAIFLNTMLVIATNTASLILAGSLTFKFVGVSPSTYHRQKVSEERLRQAIIISITSILIVGSIVGYLSYQNLVTANTKQGVETHLEELFGTRLISYDVTVDGRNVDIRAVVVSPDMTNEGFKEEINEVVDANVTVELIAVKEVQQESIDHNESERNM